MIGKEIKLKRILNPDSNRAFLVSLDMGLNIGPVGQLANLTKTIAELSNAGINGIVCNKGIIASTQNAIIDAGLSVIVNLMGATFMGADPLDLQPICSLEQAVTMGADAVCGELCLGAREDARLMHDFGFLAEQASELGMPLIAKINIEASDKGSQFDATLNAHGARLAYELGADMVVMTYPGSKEQFAKIVESTRIPLLLRGGPYMRNDEDIIAMVRDSLEAGGHGIAFSANLITRQLAFRLGGLIGDDIYA